MRCRRTSGGRSTATTGVERRHSNRSNPAGLEHRKKSHPSDVFLCISLRARDVAERPGDVRLRRPEWNADIRTVRARQGLNIEKRAIHRMSLLCIIESTRRRRTSGGRSPATTGAERRHSDRSNPAGLEHTKKEISNGYLLFCIIESTRRDSNPRPSPWQGDTPPLSHSCKHTFKTTY